LALDVDGRRLGERRIDMGGSHGDDYMRLNILSSSGRCRDIFGSLATRTALDNGANSRRDKYKYYHTD